MKPTLFALVGLTLSFVVDAAHAQSCTQDSDCAPEDYCERYPSSGSDSSGSEGDPVPACAPEQDCVGARDEASEAEASAPVAEETPVGRCERGGRECTQDSDCLADHFCSLDDVDLATCQVGQDCTESVPPEPRGRCEHDPYTCTADSECPDPAVCGDDGECIYHLEPCTTDDECSADYECLALRGGGSDSSSPDDSKAPPVADDPTLSPSDGSSGAETTPSDVASDEESAPLTPALIGGPSEATPGDPGSADPGSADPDSADPESGGPEPNPAPAADDPDAPQAAEIDAAEDTAPEDDTASSDDADVEGICFPTPAPCETDADCNDGWICAELDEAPPGWDEIERTCLPPGIAGALDGTIEIEGGGRGESDSGSTSADAEDPTDGNAAPIEDSDTANSAESVLGTQGGSEGSSGCSVMASGSQGRAAPWALALLALTLVLRRRGASLSRPSSLRP